MRAPGCALFVLVFLVGSRAAAEWQTFENCQLIRSAFHDGDSFRVRAGGKERIVRLYFVDAPETDRRFPDRVSEQAKGFGLTEAEVLQVGEAAKAFTAQKLSRPFAVRTSFEPARGESKQKRYYAFVYGADWDLAEQLVANGLARRFGWSAAPPGMSSPEQIIRKLERLEQTAKRQKIGAWGLREGRLEVRAHGTERFNPSSFDAFFRSPAQPFVTPSPAAVMAPRTTISGVSAVTTPGVGAPMKINVNTATQAELEKLPHIGKVRAKEIIDERPFRRLGDLKRVQGLTTSKLEELEPYLEF